MLAHANPKQVIETGQWIAYRIRCEGPRIRIWINGTQTVDYTEKEPGIATTGAIGFQSHANRASETWYRNIRVRKLDAEELEAEPGSNGPRPAGTRGPDEDGFVPLFDGKTLSGWKGDMEFWRVQDGAIEGGTLEEKVARNQYLRSEKEYDDFELRLEFKLVGVKGTNGGVDIRVAEKPNSHEMIGYQADLGTNWWGCLYEHGRGRGLLAGPEKEQRAKPVRAGQWNNYRIRCEGKRIQFWINGVQTVDYTEQDPRIPQKGIIALQVHGNLIMEAAYRNIRIKEL
jgi:hypothetical protein